MKRADRDPEGLPELLQSGYRYALTLTRQRETAEDMLHEACLALAKTDGPWERRLLFRAIKHRVIDAYRREQRRPGDRGVGGTTDPATMAVAESDAQDGVLASLVGADQVETAMGHLTDGEREAVYLTWIEGYTAREAADELGRPRGTVLSLLHRAKRKLRARLNPPCDASAAAGRNAARKSKS